MLGWIKTIMGIGSGISWVVYAVLFGLGVAVGTGATWRVMQWHVNEVVAQRDAAVQRATLAEQDAVRWHDASDLRDKEIVILAKSLKDQSAAVEAERFARSQADQAQAKAESETRDARAAFDQRLAEIEAEARAHPEQVMPVGPIVKQRVEGLWK